MDSRETKGLGAGSKFLIDGDSSDRRWSTGRGPISRLTVTERRLRGRVHHGAVCGLRNRCVRRLLPAASYGKSKFRIRRYGMSPIIFLERKFRTERLLAKRRTTVPVGDLERLATTELDRRGRVLVSSTDPATPPSPVDSDAVRPGRPNRCVADGSGPNDDRHEPSRAPDARPRIHPWRRSPVIEDKCIIEVKFRRELPSVFRRFASEFNIEIQKISKYRLGLRPHWTTRSRPAMGRPAPTSMRLAVTSDRSDGRRRLRS